MATNDKIIEIDARAYEFLRDYINTPSPVGFEVEGQRRWLEYLRDFVDDYFVDPYGTAVGVIRSKNQEKPKKVVIEAHCDEISWFVNYIDANGLIYVKRNGGTDHQIAPSLRVLIHGKNGAVKGVFGWPAIHTRLHNPEAKEPQPKVENITIDCGARTKEEVLALGVEIGSVVTYQDGYDELANGHIIGRALDNRIGGFMIACVARKLRENKVQLPYDLYIVNSVQEEIGLRGAEMIAKRLQPDLALVTDVTHDTQTPHISKAIEGDIACGKGPCLAYAPAIQRNFLQLVKEVAEREKIELQWRTLSRYTGTDTDAFAYANSGCPSMLISLPLRYMHTTVEMVHKNDVEQTIELMYHTLCAIDEKTNFAYFPELER